MGVFYQSLPMMVAAAEGFYDDEGIAVDHQRVRSSIQQFEALRDGAYDMVQTSPDNVANYRYNDGTPLGGRIDAQGFLGLDYGMHLVLATRPGITAVEDLRDRVVAVDAPTSGFAYVLYKILQRHGLRPGSDCTVVSTGGVFARYEALMRDEFDATLLSGGFETRAARRGYVLLDSVLDIADPYLGVMAAARTEWLADNHDTVVAYVRAYARGLRWTLDPAHRDEAVALLMGLPDTDRRLAEQLYEIQLRPGVGVVPDAAIAPDALSNVLALRQEFGGFEQPMDIERLAQPDGGLVDLRYRAAVFDGAV